MKDGSLRITYSKRSSKTGLYSPDGSIYIITTNGNGSLSR